MKCDFGYLWSGSFFSPLFFFFTSRFCWSRLREGVCGLEGQQWAGALGPKILECPVLESLIETTLGKHPLPPFLPSFPLSGRWGNTGCWQLWAHLQLWPYAEQQILVVTASGTDGPLKALADSILRREKEEVAMVGGGWWRKGEKCGGLRLVLSLDVGLGWFCLTRPPAPARCILERRIRHCV